MTNITNHISEQSGFGGAVASVFSVAILVVAGLLAFTAFLNV